MAGVTFLDYEPHSCWETAEREGVRVQHHSSRPPRVPGDANGKEQPDLGKERDLNTLPNIFPLT